MMTALAMVVLSGLLSGSTNVQAGLGPSGYNAGGTIIVAPGSTSAFLTPKLTLTPTTAVPNETVVLFGINFSPSTDAGGTGPNGVHQITGAGSSIINMAGTLLQFPYITYPINLDAGGTWSAKVIIPGSGSALTSGNLQFSATDTGGAFASTAIGILTRSITLDTTSSLKGTTVKVDGKGFPASNQTSPDSFSVNIDYEGAIVAGITPDFSGEFEITFRVPETALIPSSNTVTATVVGTSATATATHSVPGAVITISPEKGPTGIIFTVNGTNFDSFRSLSILSIGLTSVLPTISVTTDKDGNFTVSRTIPPLASGINTVSAKVGQVNAFTSFRITEPEVLPTPSPGPASAPPPFSKPSVGLAPLIEGDNLIRVWHFDPATQNDAPNFGWFLYDPRPVFAAANTVELMVSGLFYWINVKQTQTVTLNGKQRPLFAGWNPVTW